MAGTTSNRLEQKLDQLTEIVGDVANKVTRIETTMIEREKTDNLKFNYLEKQIYSSNERITSLEDNQKWLVRSVIGSVVTALMGIILSIIGG